MVKTRLPSVMVPGGGQKLEECSPAAPWSRSGGQCPAWRNPRAPACSVEHAGALGGTRDRGGGGGGRDPAPGRARGSQRGSQPGAVNSGQLLIT